jgi:hypothetical protein
MSFIPEPIVLKMMPGIEPIIEFRTVRPLPLQIGAFANSDVASRASETRFKPY